MFVYIVYLIIVFVVGFIELYIIRNNNINNATSWLIGNWTGMIAMALSIIYLRLL